MTSQSWEQQRDSETGKLEPMLWYTRFTAYRQMGSERTLLGSVNKVVNRGKERQTFIPGSWSRASEKWSWKERAGAYDLAEMKRTEAEYKAACAAWARDRFKFAIAARAKLDQLLAFPVVRKTKVDGDNTYIIEPLSAKEIKDIIQAYRGIDELARTTTRETLPTVKTEVSGETTVTVVYSGNASPDEL